MKLNKVYFSLLKISKCWGTVEETQKSIAPEDAGVCPNVAELTSCTSKYHIHNSSWPLFWKGLRKQITRFLWIPSTSNLWFYKALSICQDDENGWCSAHCFLHPGIWLMIPSSPVHPPGSITVLNLPTHQLGFSLLCPLVIFPKDLFYISSTLPHSPGTAPWKHPWTALLFHQFPVSFCLWVVGSICVLTCGREQHPLIFRYSSVCLCPWAFVWLPWRRALFSLYLCTTEHWGGPVLPWVCSPI